MGAKENELKGIIQKLYTIKGNIISADLKSLHEMNKEVKAYSSKIAALKDDMGKGNKDFSSVLGIIGSYNKTDREYTELMKRAINQVNDTIKMMQQEIQRKTPMSERFKELDSSMVEDLIKVNDAVQNLKLLAAKGTNGITIMEMTKEYFPLAVRINKYGNSLGGSEKTATRSIGIGIIAMPKGGEAQHTKIYLSPEEHQFAKLAAQLRKELTRLNHDSRGFIREIGEELEKDTVMRRLQCINTVILNDIAKMFNLRVHHDMLDIAQLMHEITQAINNKTLQVDESIDAMRALLIQLIAEGQKKITFGVLTRKYISTYAERVLKYTIPHNSGVAQGYTIDICGAIFGIYG